MRASRFARLADLAGPQPIQKRGRQCLFSMIKNIRITEPGIWHPFVGIAVLSILVCSCKHLPNDRQASPKALGDHQMAVLNDLRDEINFTYGFVDGWPRIDRGPCGRFAKLFYEEWNARFKDKVRIAFIMTTDGICDHVLIKLPDGSYYDGGNGVISSAALLREFRDGDRIEDMETFDYSLLDKRSYSLKRSYELCPNYSDEVTAQIIEKHLVQLPKD